MVAAHRVVKVALQLGSCAQGCHGYLMRSAPLSFQAPSPSSSIIDEFNLPMTCDVLIKLSGFLWLVKLGQSGHILEV